MEIFCSRACWRKIWHNKVSRVWMVGGGGERLFSWCVFVYDEDSVLGLKVMKIWVKFDGSDDFWFDYLRKLLNQARTNPLNPRPT
jgi:hypothetical protein